MATFPEIPNSEEVHILWRELLKSITYCQYVHVIVLYLGRIQKEVKEFVGMFTGIYPAKHVTPYMHAMMMHVSQFMEIHGAILPLSNMEWRNITITRQRSIFVHLLTVDRSV